MKNRWTEEKIALLRALAPTGMFAADIGIELGFTQAGVINVAARNGIAIIKYSPAEQARYDESARVQAARRAARKKTRNKEAKIAHRKQAFCQPESPEPALSRSGLTLPELRKLHPIKIEMTKGELRAFLAQAVRNTAGASL
jgi:hypothetical protein